MGIQFGTSGVCGKHFLGIKIAVSGVAVHVEFGKQNFGPDLVGLTHERVHKKVQQKRAHVKAGRVGEVDREESQATGRLQPVSHLIVELLVVAIAAYGRQLRV